MTKKQLNLRLWTLYFILGTILCAILVVIFANSSLEDSGWDEKMVLSMILDGAILGIFLTVTTVYLLSSLQAVIAQRMVGNPLGPLSILGGMCACLVVIIIFFGGVPSKLGWSRSQDPLHDSIIFGFGVMLFFATAAYLRWVQNIIKKDFRKNYQAEKQK